MPSPFSRFYRRKDDHKRVPAHTDLLTAVPLPRRGVDARPCKGFLQLHREIEPRMPLLKWLILRFRLDRSVRLVLDKHGSYFWKLLDGERNLRQISERMSRQFALEIRECEHAVLLYTKMLMRRHFIELILPPHQPLFKPETSHA